MMKPLLLLALLCLLTPALAKDLTLRVVNPTGLTLPGQPLRNGVPFARGVLTDPAVQLQDATGKPLPCQARPIAKWYDGSVKWLLVDTRLDVPADGMSLKLLPGQAAALQPRVTVTDTAQEITVDSGPARFVFSKRQFALPLSGWVDLNDDGKEETQVLSGPGEFVCEVEHTSPGEPQEENWLRKAGGGPRERFSAAPGADYKCEIENANDLRAVVKLSGWLTNAGGRKLIQYIIRAHVLAGQRELKLSPTFVYAGKAKQDFIRAMYLRFPRKSGAGATNWAFGGDKRHEGALSGSDSVSLTEIGPEKIYHLAPYDQDKSVRYSVTQSGREVASGTAAAGWARLADGTSSLECAVRNFWQNHPKEIRLQRDALTVYLWPESGNMVLDFRRRYDEVENTYHYDLSLWEFGGEGVGKTHEIALRFCNPQGDTAAQLATTLDNPPLLQCDPAYLAETGVFGPIIPSDRQRFPHLETWQDAGVGWMARNQSQFHWDGLIDYGCTLFHGYNTPSHYGYRTDKGWCSRGYVGWLNDDGGLDNALFLRYVRTGEYATFRLAENLARHSMDVDTCHYCEARPREVGGGHRHDQQHWGNGCRGYGTATHGIIDYYLLTGDERALDVARETAGYHDDGEPSEDEDRVGGLIRFWEISGEERWKKRALELLEAELKPASPTWFFATTGHFRMVLNTSTGFVYTLSCLPPEETVKLREAIVKTTDASREAHMSAWDGPTYLPLTLTALAYHVTGDGKYAEQTAALVQRMTMPWKAEAPADLQQQMQTMPFVDVVKTAGAWGHNNLYSMELSGFNAMPYVQSALAQAGLDETGMLAVVRTNNPAPPFEETMDPKKISHEIGNAYTYYLEHGSPSDRGAVSRLVLYEDGKPLGPNNTAHATIRTDGAGRYSHWGPHSLWFSTSDNSDPRTNGRTYKIVNP